MDNSFFLAAGPTPADWFNAIVNRLLYFVVWPLFIGLAILMFIWAGGLFLTARGDPAKIAEAKKAFIYGIVGIIVAILAFSIKGIVSTILIGAP